MNLDVVSDLLEDLETVTIAGLGFTMDKVVGLLRRELDAAEAALAEPQRRVMERVLDDLGRESSRGLPDASRFVARAQVITSTLSLI